MNANESTPEHNPVNQADQPSNYKYWAFISYSSKDTAVAKRFHTKLETYRIPKELVGRPGRDATVPSRLFPVFRDRDELPLSHDLGATIQDALRASRYLIVLCSPHAAQSKWVNEEVRYFKSLGREDRILAVIVSGIPNGTYNEATTNQECFPPALRYRIDARGQLTDERTEPIAGDLRKGGDGPTSVLLKAIAGITGVGYDAFAKREAKRAARKRMMFSAVAFLLLCAGVWYWDYSRLKVHYFAQTGHRWGIPHGISPLGSSQRLARQNNYRLESRGYKVRRVEWVNSTDALVEEDGIGAARTDVVYREDGSLERLLFYNRNGKLVRQNSYSKPGTVNENGLRPCTITFLSKSEFAQTLNAEAASLTSNATEVSESKRSDITAYQAFFDAQGRMAAIYFRNAYGSPISDPSGVYGQAFEYDTEGLITKTTNLDAAGSPMPDRRGVQAVRRSFGPFSALERQAFLDSADKPILGPEHVATFIYQVDSIGNQTEQKCFDQLEQPTLHKAGFHRKTWKYDTAGNMIASDVFDVDDQPAMHADGYAGGRFEYNADGRLTGVTYLGRDGQPTFNKNGISIFRLSVDKQGNWTEMAAFDPSGQPKYSQGGWSKVVSKYDSQGNTIEATNYDPTGQLVLTKYGVAKTVHVYDERGNHVQTSYYGTDAQPCIDTEGIASMVKAYDERGNMVDESYYGTDQKPTIHKDGMARKTFQYDEHGNMVECNYWGMNGQSMNAAEGYARFTQRFDDRGNCIEAAYFNATGIPTLNKEGFARRTSLYDERGFEVRRDFFGTDGRPIKDSHGRARIEYVRDRYGNEQEQRVYDRNYLPATDEYGVFRLVTKLDDRGNNSEFLAYGPTGAPVLHSKFKAARMEIRYDERGHQLSLATFGLGNEPVIGGEGKFARRTRSYDTRGNVIEESYFGIDGKLCRDEMGIARQRFEYDDRNNIVLKSFYGVDDQPIESYAGIAQSRMVYDATSRKIEESYLNLQGALVEDSQGAARVTQKYDGLGNAIEQAYYDANNQPTAGPVGAARIEISYDVAGNITERRYFGVDGKPILGDQGFAICRATYDIRGEFLELETFGVDGQPCVSSLGAARMVREFDRLGHNISEAAFGADGKPMMAKGRYARMNVTYDELGNLKERTYWDETGKLTASFEGVAKALYQYDDRGNLIELSCFGPDEKPALNKDGYARMAFVLDEQGRMLEQATYGVDGQLVVTKNGWAKQRQKFDARGNAIEISYWDAQDKAAASEPNGIARATVGYNESGQLTEMQRFGKDGERFKSPELAYTERQTYHPNGTLARYEAWSLDPERVPEESLNAASTHMVIEYDLEGHVTKNESLFYMPIKLRGKGTAVFEKKIRDTAGREIGNDYLDESGKLALGPNAYASDRITLDESGNAVRVEGFDEAGKRVKSLLVGGVELHSGLIDVKYDRLGRPIEYLVLDENDQPIVSAQYPYKATYEYGRSEKPTQFTQHFNLPPNTPRTQQGSPPIRGTAKLDSKGETREMIVVREVSGSALENNLVYSVVRANAAGLATEVRYEDAQGNLVVGPDGFARQTVEYDRFNKSKSMRFYGLNGLMIHPKLNAAGTDITRDDQGREIEFKRIGIDGRLLEDNEGVAMTRRKWDDQGRVLIEGYYDRSAKMVRKAGQFARFNMVYDDQENSSEQRFYDEKGKPIAGTDKVFRRLVKKSKDGRELEETYFDQDGKPMASNQGVYGARRKLDSKLQPIELVLLNAEGKPFVAEVGYAKLKTDRDAQGKVVVEQYLDDQDRPIALTAVGGHHRIETQYDANGRPRLQTYFFATDQSPDGLHGVFKLERSLDALGSEIELKHLDKDEQLVMHRDGYAILHKSYDAKQRQLEEWTADANDKPCNSIDGYCRTAWKYEGDAVSEIRYTDMEGNVVDGPRGFAVYQRKTSKEKQLPEWLAQDASGRPAACRVVVEKVMPASQAERIGLQIGDEVVSYNRIPIVHFHQVIELTNLGIEETRELEILRNRQPQSLSVQRGRLGAGLRVEKKSIE